MYYKIDTDLSVSYCFFPYTEDLILCVFVEHIIVVWTIVQEGKTSGKVPVV